MSIERARQIYTEYKYKNSQIDSGNLYWALGEVLRHLDNVEPMILEQEEKPAPAVYGSFNLDTVREWSGWSGTDEQIVEKIRQLFAEHHPSGSFDLESGGPVMISKDQFCDHIRRIQEFDQQRVRVSDFMNEEFFHDSSPSVCDFGGDLMSGYMMAISSHFRDPEEVFGWIEYALWPGGIIPVAYVKQSSGDDKKYELDTADKLYNYLTEYYSGCGGRQ